MIYVKVIEDKKQIQGSKSLYPALLGGVIKARLLPPVDKVPEDVHIVPVYITNHDSDYHDLLVNADEPMAMQPVLECEPSGYRALLVHEVNGYVQLELHEDFGVIEYDPRHVLEVDQAQEAQGQADPA